LIWFRSFVNNRQSFCTHFTHLFITIRILSGSDKDVFLSPLRFNIFVKDLFNIIKHSKYLLFGDDVKIFRAVNSVDGSILLQSNTERRKGWFSASFVKLNIIKIVCYFY